MAIWFSGVPLDVLNERGAQCVNGNLGIELLEAGEERAPRDEARDRLDEADGRVRLDAADERVDAQILGPHAFQRRQAPAEHVIASGEEPRAIKRP